MRTFAAAMAVLTILGCSMSAAAKEPTRKIIIEGGGLAGLVELTDSVTLALSDVYRGNFLGSPTSEVPLESSARYEISFYLPDHDRGWFRELLHGPRLKRAYVVYFVPDTVHHTGYVYLPGDGDSWAGWNHGVIIRERQEGRWSIASPSWNDRITRAIRAARRLPPPRCPVTDRTGVVEPRDAVFADVAALTAVLETHGLHVLCAYHTTFDWTLGQRGAGFETSVGSFAVLFFSAGTGADSVRVTTTVIDGQLLTVLRRPDPRSRADSLFSADRTDIILHGRWLFDTWGQEPVRFALLSALGAVSR
ncbi:MAG: hypothetical protein ACHQRK_09475 [Gemmatimonadales bacterium]